MSENAANYPATLSVDYAGQSDRLKTLLRCFLAIPILVILGLLMGGAQGTGQQSAEQARRVVGVGLVVVPTVLMILFRQKYPRWWFDWNLALTKFMARVAAYVLLLRDEYPSTDEEQAVHIEVSYPNAAELNRWLPLVKWLLALPHMVVLAILWAAVICLSIVAWFIILFTGRYPKDLFDFVVGVMRWSLRVNAYATLLITDQYPPFRLGA
jgi:hypothetical protein